MPTLPLSFTWSASGRGGIDLGEVFSATQVDGPLVVVASADGFIGTASVTVMPAVAPVVLSDLA